MNGTSVREHPIQPDSSWKLTTLMLRRLAILAATGDKPGTGFAGVANLGQGRRHLRIPMTTPLDTCDHLPLIMKPAHPSAVEQAVRLLMESIAKENAEDLGPESYAFLWKPCRYATHHFEIGPGRLLKANSAR